MPLLPENNPFVPNPKTYWCHRCKTHSEYQYYRTDISSGGGTNTTYEKYRCKACNASMFTPDDVAPWMKGLLGVTFVLVLAGGMVLVFEGDVLLVLVGGSGYGMEENFWDLSQVSGESGICLLMGGFFGLIGGSMYYYMRKWYAWVSCQNKKSPEELILEAKKFKSQGE
jgi:hypothetical protein